MKKENKQYWALAFAVLAVIIASVIFVNIVKATSENEKINKVKIISSDLIDRDMAEISVDELGSINVMIMINASFCDNGMTKTYYLAPEQSNDYINYTTEIYTTGDCKERIYYESAKFNLLANNLSVGIFDLYREYDGAPLFMDKIEVKGSLPNAVIAGTGEQVNMTLLNQVLQAVLDVLNYVKAYFQKPAFEPRLSVTSDKWARLGENWHVYANYTDQNGNAVVGGKCKVNTDKWGVLEMNYDSEKKLYTFEHVADSIDAVRWTVACY